MNIAGRLVCWVIGAATAAAAGCKGNSGEGRAIDSEQTAGRINIPSDPKATYYVVEKKVRPPLVALTTKRVGPSGTSYTQREFNCDDRTAKDLADGDSLEEFRASSKRGEKPYPLVDGSIADVLWQHACAGVDRTTREREAQPQGDPIAKMAEFKDAMCNCKDASCAQAVSDRMVTWSQNQAAQSPVPPQLSPEDTKRAAELGETMGKCLQAAMGN